ncbi:unnamed protein product, partial [Polarella glacialis]
MAHAPDWAGLHCKAKSAAGPPQGQPRVIYPPAWAGQQRTPWPNSPWSQPHTGPFVHPGRVPVPPPPPPRSAACPPFWFPRPPTPQQRQCTLQELLHADADLDMMRVSPAVTQELIEHIESLIEAEWECPEPVFTAAYSFEDEEASAVHAPAASNTDFANAAVAD